MRQDTSDWTGRCSAAQLKADLGGSHDPLVPVLVALVGIVVSTVGCGQAEKRFKEAEAAHTVGAYDAFRQTFPRSALVPIATARIESLAFIAACDTHSLEAFQNYIKTYPTSVHCAAASSAEAALAFAVIGDGGSESDYLRFVQQYPQSVQKSEALERGSRRRFAAIRDLYSEEAYEQFIRDYPECSLTNEARSELRHIREGRFEAVRGTLISWQRLRDVFRWDGNDNAYASGRGPFTVRILEDGPHYVGQCALGNLRFDGDFAGRRSGIFLEQGTVMLYPVAHKP